MTDDVPERTVAEKAWAQGFAAGVGRAAQWHTDEADRIRNESRWDRDYSDAIGQHDEYAGAIRALAQEGQGSSERAEPAMPEHFVDIVFDGPPSHESGRFVEVESPPGRSVKIGEWIERADGLWALRIARADLHAILRNARQAA